ncbi:hypothetical protein G4B88_016124 [Cannabis sativa]|uniref:Uncharacterized protein n=1 Tax=Cannabis sativa TaxID=3483 RepID=A0A7J6FGZ1_CANSA|nr:hypothetical protein G4B88_016124 [Cannabis sativa]
MREAGFTEQRTLPALGSGRITGRCYLGPSWFTGLTIIGPSLFGFQNINRSYNHPIKTIHAIIFNFKKISLDNE